MAKTKKTAKKTRKTSKKTARKSAQKKKGGFFGRAFKFCLKWGFVAGLWSAIALTLLLFWYASELPNITKSMVFERRPTVIIKASNGDIVDRYGDIKGEIIDVKDLPPHVINAVLAIEDRRFYDHFGMDLKGIARAFVVNVTRGGFVQGGSTLTQQLAKNLFLSRERTIKRKVQELMLAFQLERELTKDEILSAYLNRVYLGAGAYGIDAAARVYFNKSAKDLNLKQAATIAGLLKAPSRFSPSSNPQRAAERTKTVLRAMVEAGYATEEEIAQFKNMPPVPRRKPSSGDSVRYFTDYVVSQLDDLIGTIESDVIVETTLNKDIQNELEQSITKNSLQYGSDYEVGQAAGVFIRMDGSVVALMGGKDYSASEFNRVTGSLRPPGSSFKPIVYLAAIENGWSMDSLIVDEPIETGRYRPKNFGHEYYDEVTLFEALTLSLNTVAVNLMRDVGPDKTIALARRLGITADLEPDLSLALGSSGVPMIQMVTAYATIGRGGLAVEPFAIKKVTDIEGNILYQREPPRKNRQVVSSSDVTQITAMMQSVIQNGTGKAASIPYPAAGKTGTSQDFRDAWFIGFTNKYAGAIWFGNDDNSPTKRLTGGSIPARVWREVMMMAQTKGGRSYGNFSDINFGEHGFDDLLSKILNDAELDGERGGFFDWLGGISGSSRQKEDAPANEYTPLGRHQWNLNE
jgi:penicillin-binding protein 1A